MTTLASGPLKAKLFGTTPKDVSIGTPLVSPIDPTAFGPGVTGYSLSVPVDDPRDDGEPHHHPTRCSQGTSRPAGDLHRHRRPVLHCAGAAPDGGGGREALTRRPMPVGGGCRYAPGTNCTRKDERVTPGDREPDRWWHGGVFYQIYPRSFADSNGDGAGDLPGIISRLDYLAELGIAGIWLSPITVSPDRDWGYDVADYRDIDPDFGSLDDLDTLVAEAGDAASASCSTWSPTTPAISTRGSSTPASGRDAAHRDWYVWADPTPDGGPPNNWVSVFGGSAWELDQASGQYFLHNFEPEQPDLNWWNDDVRDAFDDIVRYWWDRGVAGFRIDVCNMMIKDAELRDNPPATEDDPLDQQFMGVKAVYNTDRPEAHDILRRWRAISDSYEPPRLLIGETNVDQLPTLMEFYGDGHDELHGGFNFVFLNAPSRPRPCGPSSRRSRRSCPTGPGRSGPARTTTSPAWPPAGPAATRPRCAAPS